MNALQQTPAAPMDLRVSRVDGQRIEIVDASRNGGEGQPLIVAAAWERAMADMILALPDLLSACEEAFKARQFGGHELDAWIHNSGVIDVLRAAIAKAKGRA